ncbi:MAG: hypothetical protein IJI27_05375 [Oscillospiraceae bacterium]|nr:hypothetical protein [Oscillospiraceae bacterium]
MRQLASIREDFIASDREVAALWFALKRMEEEDGPASHGIPADMTRLVKQECDCCGKVFTVRYHSNGTYDYVDEPCDCEANFSPVDGEPSISQWLEALK